MAHRADVQKVMRFRLASFLSQEKQLTGCAACSGTVDRILRHVIEDNLNGFLPAHGISVIHIVRLVRVCHYAFGSDECIDATGLGAVTNRFLNRTCELFIIVREHRIWDVKDIHERSGNLALPPMLRVVRLTVPLSPPADEQNHGNGVHIFIHQTHQRIYRITLT